MEFSRSRARRASREPVVPLINVVFLLLLFFLLAGRLRAPEHFDVEIPSSENATVSASPRDPGAAPRPAVVHLAADGRLALDGKRLELAPLASALSTRGSPAIELRADARAPARHVLPLLEALRDAGAGDVELVTLEAP